MEPSSATPEVSVVIPVYRNRATLVELLDRLDAALADEDREYVLVVDGSPDDSLELLRAEQARRPQLVVVEFSENFGQHAALCAGFETARGAVALILDADLQQRPEDLPRFLAKWRAGHDFVSGYRTSRSDPLLRRLGSRVMNRLVLAITGIALRDWGCPIAAVDRRILELVPHRGEQRRFLKPLVARLASNVCELDVESLERRGRSSYSMLTLIGVSLDAAVSFSHRPFQRLAGLGAVAFGGGTLLGVLYLGLRLLGTISDSPPVIALVVIAVLVGIQFLILGALGEFTHRIYRMVQGQPLFRVQATHRASDVTGAESAPGKVAGAEVAAAGEEGRGTVST